MSSESEGEEEVRSNYFDLLIFFDKDCTPFLRQLLENFFSSYTDLLEKLPHNVYQTINPKGIITKEQQSLLEKERSISKKFKFELLCNIFRAGVCDDHFGPPSLGWISEETPSVEHNEIGDDVLKLWKIWNISINQNEDEEISQNDNEDIWSTLRGVAERMADRFPTFGKKFWKKIVRESEKGPDRKVTINSQVGENNNIEHTLLADSAESLICNQYGSNNRISARNTASKSVETFICKQEGENCKIAIKLADQTQSKLKIEGKGELRLTLHCSDRKAWPAIADSISSLSIEELNEDKQLKDNPIKISGIQMACLLVDVEITGSNIEGSMHILMDCLLRKSNAFQILLNNNLAELNVYGYYYQPESYIDPSDSDMNFVLFSHITLELHETVSDVDVFVSDSMYMLIQNQFKVDVDENIRVQIKGDVVDPEECKFSDIQKAFTKQAEEQLHSINPLLASDCDLQLVHVLHRKSATHVIFKTKSRITYGNLIEQEGPVLSLLRQIFKMDGVEEMLSNISLMRIAVLINTSMDEEIQEESTQGIVFHLSPESGITEAVGNNKFPELIQKILCGKNKAILKGVEQLKIRAVLDYGRNDDESDQAIDITETFEQESSEEDFQSSVKKAKDALQLGNILEAKELARIVFQKLLPEHIDIYIELREIFKECADNFYALKCFCLVRLLGMEFWDPFSLVLSMEYWIPVIHGPYNLQEIQYLFKEIEDLLFGYLKQDDYCLIAKGICFELLMSYGELAQVFSRQSDVSYINKRMSVVEFHICHMYFRKGNPQVVCAIYKKRDRSGWTLDADNLYMWALALRELGKLDVALKKVEEAIQIFQTEESTETESVFNELIDLRDTLNLESVPETKSELDDEWLAGTNISIPQQMKVKALKVQESFKKKKDTHQAEAQEKEQIQTSPIEDFESFDFNVQYEDTTKYRTWKDAPSYIPEPYEKKKKRRHRSKSSTEIQEDFNVVYEERESEADSGQDSHESSSELEQPTKKPFYYEAPEYQNSQIDTSSDSGIETFDDESNFEHSLSMTDKRLSNSDLVIFGITLKDRCKASFQKNKNLASFQYQNERTKEEILLLLRREKNKYKRCMIELESAHKATCTNLDLTDEIKEILISGRSKCGRSFTDDEVVVEILGESKAPSTYIPRLKIDLAKERKDNNIYGKVIGRLKRNRYGDLEHPVLICAKDEFADHMMKPLCKTVPKINVSHEFCKNKYQVDLFSYDANRNVVEYRETLDINHAYKKSYCYLVAIISWDDMYPFGITLKVINTRGDIKSGIGILRLQYRVPSTYRTEITQATATILHRKENNIIGNKNVITVFTIHDGKQGPIETAYSITLLKSGLYRIGIHVVDPSSTIKKRDILDTEAQKRGTDFYVNKDIEPVYMIPEHLSHELFSFELGKERQTLTIFFTAPVADDDLASYDNFDFPRNVERTTVRSEKQYNIRDIQTLLKTKRGNSDIHKLHLVSEQLRKQRIGNASFFTDINEMFPYEKNNFIECMDAYLLVQELHIFANHTVASYLFEKYPDCLPCKCHNRPSQNVLLRWKKAHDEHMEKILFSLQDYEMSVGAQCTIFDKSLDRLRYRNLIPVQNTVWEVLRESSKAKQIDKFQLVLGADEIHPMQALALEEWLEIQENAEYKCSVQKNDAKHFDLRVPIYTSFTAPLSRYVDLVVHRMVHAALDNIEVAPYSKAEIQSICTEMNNVNRIRKQFRNSCLILLFGHSLNNVPRIFNGFVQNVTNNDVELLIPTLRKLPRTCKLLPINLLHSRQKPDFVKAVGSDRYIMTVKWQNRIYSLKRRTRSSPNEMKYLRINPHKNVKFHQMKKWVNIMRALMSAKTRNIYSLMVAEDPQGPNQQIPESWDTVNDVSSEVSGGNFAQQTCSYSLSFNYGQVLVIQMCAEPDRGMMTPLPQLFDITPNVKICLQHARDPLGVLSSMATKSAKEKYVSCKEYIDIWMPIFSMEVATQTADDDSFTINDLPVTFRERGGAFSLKYSFLEKRDIEFTAHSVDLLNAEEEIKDSNENERFYMSGSDFLCIRCPLETVSDIVTNFGNGAISPKYRYWIGHAQVHDVRFKTKKNEKVVSVTFVCHNRSPSIPQEMLNKKKECNVEILPKSDVSRRTELYVKWLEGASELAKAIALRKRIPDLDKIHKDMGDQVRDLEVPELRISYNENQRKAVKRALTSSFSLIQGPPGTGKTFTGVALINLFCSINRKYLEMKGGNKHFVVFCGPSNKSVDLVTVYLKESFQHQLKILRMYGGALECKEFPIPGKVFSMKQTECAPDESLRDLTLHHIIRKPGNEYAEKIRDFDRKFKNEKIVDYRDIKQYKKYIAKAVKEEIPKYDVILCTTAVATSSRLLNATGRSIYQLLIDEAGMCTEPECVATIVATHAKQVVLIGDHKQLQPVVLCEEAGELGLQKSLFERYAESKKSEKVLTLLTNQYRMHSSLCRFPSNAFYDNKLITQKSPRWEVLQPLSMWHNPKNPLVFCHIEGEEEYLANTTEEGNEMSRFNKAEIDQVEKLYLHLVKKEGVRPEDINIMSQYNAQCSKIRERLKKQHVQHVNTVVASQGGEWDYVIFSLVRSLPEYRIEPHPTIGWCKENLGFITDDHQINVALTRARKGLVIIGNKRLMQCDGIFKMLLDEYARHGCTEDAENFPPPHKKKDQRRAWIP